LHATGAYEIHALGINYHGEPANHPASPWHDLRDIPTYPASYYPNDPRGERRLIELLLTQPWDVLVAIINPWDLQRLHTRLATVKASKGFRFVYYFPVEDEVDPQWVERAIGLADVPIAYTHHGAREVLEASGLQCEVIYHGVDAHTFRRWRGPGRDEFRRKRWDVQRDTPVLINVNRNQPRKDLPRSMLVADGIARRLKRPVALHLHADPKDHAGADLEGFARRYIDPELVRITYGRPGLRHAPDAELAQLYAAADLMLTTAWCEGWGLSTVEALAAELPVVAPGSSVFPELLEHGGPPRGYLAHTRGFAMLPGQTGLFSLPDVDDMAELATTVLQRDPVELGVDAVTAAGRRWVLEHCDWDRIGRRWDELLASVC
jgi:glycosyltransferase involved in cell wall biosynthesis